MRGRPSRQRFGKRPLEARGSAQSSFTPRVTRGPYRSGMRRPLPSAISCLSVHPTSYWRRSAFLDGRASPSGLCLPSRSSIDPWAAHESPVCVCVPPYDPPYASPYSERTPAFVLRLEASIAREPLLNGRHPLMRNRLGAAQLPAAVWDRGGESA